MIEDRRVKSIDQFLVLLAQSKLADETQIDALKRQFRNEYLPASDLPDTVTTFCTFVVGQGVLTPWQCEKLRNGQWKGFFLDTYALLDSIGDDHRNNYYLGHDMQSGRFIRNPGTPKVLKLNTASMSKLPSFALMDAEPISAASKGHSPSKKPDPEALGNA